MFEPPFGSPHYFVLVAPVSALVAFLWCVWLSLGAVTTWHSMSLARQSLLGSALLVSAGLL